MAGRCASCGAIATAWCKACRTKDGTHDQLTDAITTTYYCSTACQKADWIEHEVVCLARRNVGRNKATLRACAIAQDFFYIFRQSTFDHAILGVEQIGDTLLVRDIDMDNIGSSHQPIHPGGRIFPFPTSFFQNELQRKAVLVWRMCDEAIICTVDLVRWLLGGKSCIIAFTASGRNRNPALTCS